MTAYKERQSCLQYTGCLFFAWSSRELCKYQIGISSLFSSVTTNLGGVLRTQKILNVHVSRNQALERSLRLEIPTQEVVSANTVALVFKWRNWKWETGGNCLWTPKLFKICLQHSPCQHGKSQSQDSDLSTEFMLSQACNEFGDPHIFPCILANWVVILHQSLI